jgi:hypothetical protein|tara:strand:+ start:29 stop:361 length:333 start_codon:yes stop_codon:yes gene_type:complete
MQYSSQKKKYASNTWHIMLLVLIFGVVVSNVWQINNQAENSFTIRELEDKKQVLEEEIRDITWEVSTAQSLATVTERALELNLTQPNEIDFLEVGLSTVAVVEENLDISQ